jgi:hypothetical protein
VLAAAGFNFHPLLRWFERLLRALMLMLCLAINPTRYTQISGRSEFSRSTQYALVAWLSVNSALIWTSITLLGAVNGKSTQPKSDPEVTQVKKPGFNQISCHHKCLKSLVGAPGLEPGTR